MRNKRDARGVVFRKYPDMSRYPEQERKKKFNFCVCVFVLAYAVFFFIPDTLFLHMDLGWHLATGELIRKLGALPASDPWSNNSEPGKWYNIYWLWQILSSYLVEKTGDLSLLFLISAGLGALVTSVVVSNVFAQGASFISATLVGFFFGLAWLFIGTLDPSVTISPKTCSALGFALLHSWVIDYFRSGKLRTLAFSTFLLAVWGNLHGLALPGVLLLAAYVIVLLSERRLKAALSLSACAVLGAALITLSNPCGSKIMTMMIDGLDDPSKANISEWQRFSIGFSPLVTAYLTTFVILFVFGHRHIDRKEKAQCFFWLVMGLNAVRHLQFFMIVSAPALARLFDFVLISKNVRWSYFETLLENFPLFNKKLLVLPFAICSLSFIIVRFFISYPSGFDFPVSLYPQAALRYVEKNLSSGKLINDWNFGGFIIYKARGKVKVWIDGRAATVYPDKVILDWTRLQSETKKVLNEYRPDMVFIGNKRPANDYLETSNEWKKVYFDPVSNVFVREKHSRLDNPTPASPNLKIRFRN